MLILDSEWLGEAYGKRWLVGVSGGRDSVALLHSCVVAFGAGCADRLVVCHVNHRLRGDDSDGDEGFVRSIAGQYGLPLFVHQVDVGLEAEVGKKSVELAARDARHEAYVLACSEFKCDGVLLGHHADDQCETVLYKLLRGSAGLKGMQEESVLKDKKLVLVRPMLAVRRSEINAYIDEHALEFREDVTNAEPFAVRNRLRNEVLPLLFDIMGRDIVPSVLKSLDYCGRQEDFFEEMIDYPSMLDPQGRLHLPSLREVPGVIQQRIIHRYLSECRVHNITQALVESCQGLMETTNAAKINLPGGRFMRRKEGRLFMD